MFYQFIYFYFILFYLQILSLLYYLILLHSNINILYYVNFSEQIPGYITVYLDRMPLSSLLYEDDTSTNKSEISC